jgi:hypothetical protein
MGAFSGSTNLEEFVSSIDATYSRRDHDSKFPPLSVFLLHSQIRPEEMTSVNMIDKKFSVRVVRNNDGALIEFKVKREWGGETCEESAFLIPSDNRWIVIYSGDNPTLIRGLFGRLQPLVSPVRIYSHEFMKLTDGLSKRFKDIEMVEAFLRKPRQSLRAQRSISREELKEFVEKEHRWIQRIRYSIRKSEERDWFLDMSIDREGHSELFSGHLSAADAIFDASFQISESKNAYWSEKQPVSDSSEPSSLGKIVYDKPLGKQDLSTIIEAIEGIENMYSTVVHSGNPFLSVHLLDSVDGSSFDLFAGGKEVTLIPVQKVTPNAYMRTTEALFKKLREGRLA